MWDEYGFRRLALVARLRQVQAALARQLERAQAANDLAELHATVVEAGSPLLGIGGGADGSGGRHAAVGRSQVTGRGEQRPAAGLRRAHPATSEVLELVATGATNRQVGTQLYISEKTASVHVSRILAKLGVSGREDAARLHRQQRAGR